MNQKNFQYLTETLAGLGFGDFFNGMLKTKMELGQDEFQLFGDKQKSNKEEYTRFAPQFSKSKNDEFNDFYFLNKIKATTHKANGETISAEFKIFKKSGFNVREMENLLTGGPVYRINNGEGKWYKLDISNLDENGMAPIRSYADVVTRFNLEREVDKVKIIFSNKYEKNDLLQDLRSGDKVEASIKENGKIERVYLQVAPQLGGLVIVNTETMAVRYTNSNSMAAVNEGEGQKNNMGMKQVDDKIPAVAKAIMEKANEPGKEKGLKSKIG